MCIRDRSYIWVTTYPTSNMGEAHTQEHLLVGKGSKGRALGSKEDVYKRQYCNSTTATLSACFAQVTSQLLRLTQ